MPKPSDTQSILLSHAAQRDSGSLLPLPGTLSSSGAGVAKSITALIKHGLAEERETIDAACVRRTDGDLRYGVFVTVTGLAAIGIVEEDALDAGVEATVAPCPTLAAASAAAPPRATKSAAIVELLSRDGGATLVELIAATGWLPHTTRAALTGLRKKGHAIVRGTRDGATCYTIGAAA